MTAAEHIMGPAEYLDWCSLLGRPEVDVNTLSPRDRAAALPPWCVLELRATAAAEARLRAWVVAGATTPTAEDLVRRLRYLGDDEVRSVVLVALHERVPPPAAAFLLDTVLFLGVGWSSAGRMIRCATPPGPILNVILVSGAPRDGAAVLDVVLHEMAHAWTLPDPPPIAAEDLSNEYGAVLLAAAKRPDMMRDILRDEARDEEIADSLARAWGGRLVCTAARDNAGTMAAAARLHELHGKGEAALLAQDPE